MNFLKLYKKEFLRTIIVIVASAAFFLALVLPLQRKLAAERKTLGEIDKQINAHLAAIDDLENLIKEETREGDFIIGDGEEILPKLLDELAGLGKKHKVAILSMRPGEPEEISTEPRGDVTLVSEKLVIRMKLKADYRNLGEYLRALEGIHVLVAVKGLKIVRPDPEDQSLEADILIETYSIQNETEKA